MDFSLSKFLSGLWGEPYDWVKWVHRNSNDNVSFDAGFMVYPNGEIRLNTPYGGK